MFDPRDKKMLNVASKEDLIIIIEATNRIQDKNYKELKSQYETADRKQQNYTRGSVDWERLEGFKEGLLSGMVMLDKDLKSVVMEGKNDGQ